MPHKSFHTLIKDIASFLILIAKYQLFSFFSFCLFGFLNNFFAILVLLSFHHLLLLAILVTVTFKADAILFLSLISLYFHFLHS